MPYIDLDVAMHGTRARWIIENEGPVALERLGWTKETLMPGDIVTITGARARDGATQNALCQRDARRRSAPPLLRHWRHDLRSAGRWLRTPLLSAAAFAAALLAAPVSADQAAPRTPRPAAPARAARPARNAPPRLANGKPDLQGIWQVRNTANWNLQAHGGSYKTSGRPRRRGRSAGRLDSVPARGAGDQAEELGQPRDRGSAGEVLSRRCAAHDVPALPAADPSDRDRGRASSPSTCTPGAGFR